MKNSVRKSILLLMSIMLFSIFSNANGGSEEISSVSETNIILSLLLNSKNGLVDENAFIEESKNNFLKPTLLDCDPPTNFQVQAVDTFEVELSWTDNTSGTGSYVIEYGPAGFTYGTGLSITAATSPATITGLDPSTEYDFYIYADCGGGDVSTLVGPVSATTLNLCNPVSDVEIDSIGIDMVLISWTAGGTETVWNIEYGPQGFVLGNGTLITGINDNPYLLVGLDSNADYDVYIQADCDPIDQSSWVGPIAFSTAISCEDIFFDNGGASSEYLPNSDEIYKICPENIGDYVKITFNSFITEDSLDGIYVFDGPDINSPLIPSSNGPGNSTVLSVPGAYWGDSIPGPFESTSPGGCLTLHFLSDGSTQLDGFEVDVECFGCNPTPGEGNEIDVCRLDDTLDLNLHVLKGTADDSSISGQWLFPAFPGFLFDDTLLLVTFLPPDLYSAFYVIQTPCGIDTTTLEFTIYPPSSAGENGTVSVCRNQPVNLFEALSGNADLGGQWYDPSGNPISGSQPVSSNIPGSFNFDYIASNGVCPADTQFVEVLVANCDWLSVVAEKMQEIKVFPNPANEVLNILNGSNLEGLKIEMYDAMGRLVLTDNKALANTIEATISIAHLETGAYTMRVRNNEGEKVFKIIKQ